MTSSRTAMAVIALLAGALLPLGAPAAQAAPPDAPVVTAVELRGERAVLALSLPDPSTTSLRVTRTSEGAAPVTRVVARTERYTELGVLRLGTAYAYEVRALNAAGEASAPATTRLVATQPPEIRVPRLVSEVSTTTSFPVSVGSAFNAADTTYTVDGNERSRFASYTGPGPTSPSRFPWLTAVSAGTRTFGRPASTGVAATTSVQDATYFFTGYATDRFGNRTSGVASPTASVPIDQVRLRPYRGRARTVEDRPGAFGTTVTLLENTGAGVDVSLRGQLLYVVGERCPSCGQLDVLVNGRRAARVDTHAPTTSTRQVLFARSFSTERLVSLGVRAVVTPSRPVVVLDAIGGRRAAERLGIASGAGLVTGESLQVGGRLRSVGAEFDATLRPDGNLVVSRRVGGSVLFQTRTAGTGAERLALTPDCDLVLLSGSGRIVWQTRPACSTGGAAVVMQRDGNLVVTRASDGAALWSSRTGRLV